MAASDEIRAQRARDMWTGNWLREEEQERIDDERKTRALCNRNRMSLAADPLSKNVPQTAERNAEA